MTFLWTPVGVGNTGAYSGTRFFSTAVYDNAPVPTALADDLFDAQIAPEEVPMRSAFPSPTACLEWRNQN
jgi:hypothetical protein